MGITVAGAFGGVAVSPAVLILAGQSERKPGHWLTLPWRTAIIVAVLLAIAAALLANRHGGVWLAAAACPLVVGAAAALIDIRESRLPNRLTVAMLVAALVTAIVIALIDDPETAARGLAAGAIATGMMFIAKMIRPTAVGWGDVKLAPGLGCYLGLAGGWDTIYVGLFLWWLLIAMGAMLGLVTGLLRRDDPMPYGPAMLLGTLVAVLVA